MKYVFVLFAFLPFQAFSQCVPPIKIETEHWLENGSTRDRYGIFEYSPTERQVRVQLGKDKWSIGPVLSTECGDGYKIICEFDIFYVSAKNEVSWVREMGPTTCIW